MKVSIIGYNIFGIGGTSRSNLNTLYEFYKDSGNDLTYYNFCDFTIHDKVELIIRESFMKKISLCKLDDLFNLSYDEDDTSLYFITRENFFSIAKFLRERRPNSIILGEIHAPLAYLSDELELPYFSSIRVATEGIKKEFMVKFSFDRVFVQRVSLCHVSGGEKNANEPTKNFVVFSRFYEKQKDIAYSIKLMDYIINYLGNKDIHFYIQGEGIGGVLYKNLISYYELNNNIFINKPLPSEYIYLSTASLETLGYSIIEAISDSKLACVYKGDDNVIYENFFGVKAINWLTKDLFSDALTLLEATQLSISGAEMTESMHQILNPSRNYSKNILENVEKYNYISDEKILPLTKKEIRNIQNKISNTTIQDDEVFSNLRRYYLKFKRYPVLGPIISNKKLRTRIKKLISYITQITQNKNKEIKVKNNYFFFESFHGSNFSGDPKYLALAIKEKYPDAKVFVSSINQLVDIEIRNYGFEAVRIGSKLYLDAFAQSKYIFVNGNSLDKAGKSNEQTIVQTWHGFPIKKMVADLEDTQQREQELSAFIPRMKKWDYLITSSDYHSKLLSSAFQLNKNKHLEILNLGTPKNSYLIENRESNKEKEKIHLKYLNKPMNKKTKYILFCPTWRKTQREKITSINLKEVISLLPEEYEIIVKLHPLEGNLRSQYSRLDRRIHCFFNELVDIQELYLLCEVLISDYSSAIFDFAHTGKKVILLQEDSEAYSSQIGMYFDAEKLLDLKGRNYNAYELSKEILKRNSNNQDYYRYNTLITNELLNADKKDSAQRILEKIGL